MRASEEFLARVDNWRRVQSELPSRSEAIRKLVELGLKAASQLDATAEITHKDRYETLRVIARKED